MSRPKPRTPQSLLVLIDGGYQRNEGCECPSKEHTLSTKITYSKFSLNPACCQPYCLCCGVVLTLLVIAIVVLSIFSLLPLAVSIPVGIVALLCATCGFFSFANIDKNQHGHVVVDFKCYQCNHEHKMLYDCITLEKRARRGYYRKECTLLDRSTTERTYEFIEKAYEEMRDGLDKCYYPGSYTCNTWAGDFYEKIRKTLMQEMRKSRLPQRVLMLVDGGFTRDQECECSKEHLRTTKISLAEFPMHTERSRRGCLCCGVICGLLLIVIIALAVYALLPLFISIPIGLLVFFISFCGILFFVILPQSQHRHVEIEFKCLECDQKFCMLYDSINEMKRERCGHYSKQCTILNSSNTERTHEFVEKAYEEMRDGLDKCYYPGSYTCNTWADDFYQRVC